MTDELLNRGIVALKAGRKAEARGLLAQLVEQEPRHELGWLWLSGAVDTDEDRRVCLENVLAINPNNDLAQRGLETLQRSSPPGPAGATYAGRPRPAEGDDGGADEEIAELRLKREQLEAQIAPLEQQAGELQTLIQTLENEREQRQEAVAALKQEAASLQDEIHRRKDSLVELEASKAELARAQAELDALQAEQSEEEKHAAELRLRREQLEAQVTQWTQQAEELQNRVKSLEADKEQHQESLALLKQNAAKLQDEVRHWKESLTTLEGKKTAVQEKHDRLVGELDGLHQEKEIEEQHLNDLRTQRAQVEAQIAQWEQQEEELQTRVRSLEAEAQEHETAAVELRKTSKNLRARIRRREDKLEELEAAKVELAQLKNELEALQAEQSEEEKHAAELRLKREQLETQIAPLEQQAGELQTRVQGLKNEREQRQETVAALKQEAASLQDEIHRRKDSLVELEASKRELEQIPARLERARANLDRLSTQIAQDEQRVKALRDSARSSTEELNRLRELKYSVLWKEILRSDLDVGELTLDTNLILDRFLDVMPDEAEPFRLEIAARTGEIIPLSDEERLTGSSRLFASVIQSRHVMQSERDIVAAVDVLCEGWEAVLSTPSYPVQTSSSDAVDPAPTASPVDPGPTEPYIATEQQSTAEVDALSVSNQDLIEPPVSTEQTTPLTEMAKIPAVRVTGGWSTLTLEVADRRILVDPGSSYVAPDRAPDLVVVTHAHRDHVSQLLPLCERFPDLPVVMTPETNDLLDRTLDGWARARERQVYSVPIGSKHQIQGVTVRFWPAGHLLGAAMADLSMGGPRILVTGDFTLRSVGGLPPMTKSRLPTEPYDLVLMEAVHAADKNFPTPDSMRNRDERLLQRIVHAIEEGNTRILISATSLGDAQEVYDALLSGQRNSRYAVLAGYQIYFKGMAYAISRLYAQFGVWESATPVECPDLPPQRAIVIASEGAADVLRRQFDPLADAVVFTSDKGETVPPVGRDRRYRVDLHASLQELVWLGEQVDCRVIGLYHGHTADSPLEQRLRAAGKRVLNVAAADISISLDGDDD